MVLGEGGGGESLFILFLVSGVPVFLGGEAGGSDPPPSPSVPLLRRLHSLQRSGDRAHRGASPHSGTPRTWSRHGSVVSEDRRPPPPFPSPAHRPVRAGRPGGRGRPRERAARGRPVKLRRTVCVSSRVSARGGERAGGA